MEVTDLEKFAAITANLESETAAELGSQFITYLYVSMVVEALFCTLFVAACGWGLWWFVRHIND